MNYSETAKTTATTITVVKPGSGLGMRLVPILGVVWELGQWLSWEWSGNEASAYPGSGLGMRLVPIPNTKGCIVSDNSLTRMQLTRW